MAKKSKKKVAVSAVDVLAEIDRIFETEDFYQSRQSGKRFYRPGSFPGVLAKYIASSGDGVSVHAARFGMAASTLESILGRGQLSDNMLSRIRSGLSREASAVAQKAVFPGDWRDASPAKIERAISDVSSKLLFLKKVIESNNFLKSKESPIDPIQVVQLVALLTATLEAMKAPFIDAKQTGGFFRWLGKMTRTSVEKGVEKVVVDAMADAAKAGNELMRQLAAHINVSDLGDIWS